MLTDETTPTDAAAPAAEAPAASPAPTEPTKDQGEAAEGGGAEAQAEPEKPAPSPEDLEKKLKQAQRRIDKLTGRLAQVRTGLPDQPIAATNQPAADDSEELRLPKSELQRLIKQEAAQQLEYERRHSVVKGLAEELGPKFDDLTRAADLAVGGLLHNGRPTAVTEAIFAAGKDAGALIEYLADPENEDEAEAIGRMGPIQAGLAIGEIKARIKAQKAAAKPEPSRAAPVIEPVKGGGKLAKSIFDLSGDEFDQRRREYVKTHRR